jgi:predicted transcriptional regulator
MGQDWIIDVLADLRSFARQNDMPLLGEQLEEAALVASVEIASRIDVTQQAIAGDVGETQHFPPEPDIG